MSQATGEMEQPYCRWGGVTTPTSPAVLSRLTLPRQVICRSGADGQAVFDQQKSRPEAACEGNAMESREGVVTLNIESSPDYVVTVTEELVRDAGGVDRRTVNVYINKSTSGASGKSEG